MARFSPLAGSGLAAFTTAVASLSLGACGLLTGAEDLQIQDGDGGSGGHASTGTTSGTTTGNGGSGAGMTAGGNGGSGAGSAGGSGPACSPPCGQNQYCEAATGTCQCSPGFLSQNGTCEPAPPGDPSTRTQDEVCQKWKEGHVVTTPSPLVTSGADCDAGTLKQGAINDTLSRLNMFRWLAGLGPTTDDPALDAGAQLCANLESWWDWSMGGSPHFPPASSKCFTQQGADFAGQSNLAWGSGHPAQAMDQYMEDNGNATTMGHRRWIVNPPLNPVGIGYWSGGGQYGDAQCLRVFGSSGNGPNPDWVAVPNQGFVPIEMAQWTWTFHGNQGGVPNAQISVLSVDDNMPLSVQVNTLSQGYGEEAIAWVPEGWQAQAGKTYRVTVTGVSGGDVVYDVKPVNCN